MVFDTAIVGTGPAAISAALTLKLHKKNIVWFGSRKLSPKVEKSEMIANYPGAAMVTGPELNRLYQEQIARAGLEITERQVTNILANRRGFMLQAGDEIFDAKTVLLATGSVSPTGFPGEAELLGHGVSYCATCDGFLYPGKAIAVYCGSREFEHEVIYLAEIAAKVYLFTPYSDCEIIRENITVNPGKLKSICGQEAVTGVTLTDGTILNVDGFSSCATPLPRTPCCAVWNWTAPISLLIGKCEPTSPAVLPPGTAPVVPISLPRRWAKEISLPTALWPTLRKRISNKTKQAVTLLGVAACFLRTERCSLQRIIKEKR